MTSLQELEQLFWSHVQICTHGRACKRCCWLWEGPCVKAGYGYLCVDKQRMLAHRVAMELAHGAGLFPFVHGCYSHHPRQPLRILGLHKCDSPACVNDAHLFPGTFQDNIHDAMRKGRRPTRQSSRVRRLVSNRDR
jgi:hypothetical protein